MRMASQDSNREREVANRELPVFVSSDWFEIVRSSSGDDEMIGVSVNCGEKTKDVLHVRVKHGKLVTEEVNTGDESLRCFREAKVQLLEKRRFRVELGSTRTTYIAPSVQFKSVHSSSISSADVSCTGELLVSSADDGSVKVWHSGTGELIREFNGNGISVNRCRFFPSGLVVLSGGDDMAVRVWSAETGLCHRTFTGHIRGVTDLGFIDRGKDVLSCSKDGTVKIWNCGSAECVRTFELGAGTVNALATATAEEGFLHGAAATSSGVFLVDARLGKAVRIVGPTDECSAVCFGSDFYRMVVGTEKGSILLHDLRAGGCLSSLETVRYGVTQLSSKCDGHIVASFRDGSICAYDGTLNDRVARLNFSGVEFDPIYDFAVFEGNRLYSACRDRIVRKYEIVF